MTPDLPDDPPTAAHWGTADPAAQPDREEVVSLRRLVAEACARLGAAATPDVIAAELRARGVAADPADVARHFGRPC